MGATKKLRLSPEAKGVLRRVREELDQQEGTSADVGRLLTRALGRALEPCRASLKHEGKRLVAAGKRQLALKGVA